MQKGRKRERERKERTEYCSQESASQAGGKTKIRVVTKNKNKEQKLANQKNRQRMGKERRGKHA